MDSSSETTDYIDIIDEDSESASISSCKTVSTGSTSRQHQQKIDKYTLTPKHSQRIDNALAYFVAVDMQPYSLVEKVGFQHFIQVVQPAYKLPSRKTLTEIKIPRLYADTVANLKKQLKQVHSISCTTDAWTSVSNKPFVSLTAHFIDNNWQMQSFCLNCREMSEDHTGENWASVIIDLFQEWEVSDDVHVVFTTDSGSNVLKCMEILGFVHISCFGHTLNSAVCKAFELDEISGCLKKVKKIQNLFSHSWKAQRQFSVLQDKYNVPKKKLPSYSKTRWWSLLHLIDVIVEQHLPLMAFLQEHQKGKSKDIILTIEELDILKCIVEVLKPISNMSDLMSGEQYVTASAILPLMKKIKVQFYSIDVDETQVDSQDTDINTIKIHFVQNIMHYLENRYTKAQNIKMYLEKCSMLDPRFKTHEIVESNIEQLKTSLLSEMKGLCVKSALEESKSKKSNSKGSALGQIFGSTQQTHIVQNDSVELNRYLSAPGIDFAENPLDFWKVNEKLYPKLALLAKRYLCTQATSVPSERVFSKGGLVVTDNRSTLTSQHCEELIFLSMNKKYIPKTF